MTGSAGRTAPVVLVTGTGTDIGKTVVTAALVVRLRAQGLALGVVKVAQTGVLPGATGDLSEVERLAGPVPTYELVRLSDPLAPATAARLAGLPLPTVAEHAARIGEIGMADGLDVVVVEGAGGLLVHLDSEGATFADLGLELARLGIDARYLVVVRPGLGTLNEATLTLEALDRRALTTAGLVIGSWPAQPDLAQRCNLTDLPAVAGVPLLGRVPAGVGAWDGERFRAAAGGWLDLPVDLAGRVAAG